ncbi:MAG: oligosaccharide flippase family protein [Candidatus Methanomethylicaceae archaeon]
MSLWSQLQTHLTPAARQAAWNFAWMVLARLVSQAALLGVVLVLARSLTTKEFGMFMTALALQGYVYLIGSAGMGPVVVRELVRQPNRQVEISSTYFLISLIGGLITWTIVSAATVPLAISAEEKILISVMALGAALACANPEPLYDAAHQQWIPALVGVAADIFFFTIVVLTVYLTTCPLWIGLAFAIKWSFNVLVLLRLPHAQALIDVHEANFGDARKLWLSGRHILLATLLSTFLVTGPTVVARVLHGEAAAGAMGLGVQVLQVYLTFFSLAGRVLHPHIVGPFGLTRSFLIKLALVTVALSCGLFVLALGAAAAVTKLVPVAGRGDSPTSYLLLLIAGLIASPVIVIYYYVVRFEAEWIIHISFGLGVICFAIGIWLRPVPLALPLIPFATVTAWVVVLATQIFLLRRLVLRAGPLR